MRFARRVIQTFSLLDAAELMHIHSTRSGNTKEIVAAIKYCKEAGARTLVYVSNDNTPACEYADYKFFSFAEDDCLCEAIYTYMITLLARFKKNAGEFDKYDEFVEQYSKIVPYLLKAKEQYEDRCAKMAVEHKLSYGNWIWNALGRSL